MFRRHVVRVQAAGAVEDEAVDAPLPFDGDVDEPAEEVVEAPEDGCIEVTQGGALPAGDDSGHPSCLLRERDMPDRVHTGVKAVKVAARHPAPDRRRRSIPIARSCRRPTTPCCLAAIRASRISGCALKISRSARFFLHTPSVAGGVLRVGDLCEGFAGEGR